MTRYDPAFAPRSSTIHGVLLNSTSIPALLSHGVEIVPAPCDTDFALDEQGVIVTGSRDVGAA